MRQLRLHGTNLSVSRFVFGTASLHHLGRLSVQAEHLEAAAAAGITHFDTAPLYGFGMAEKALGEAFGGDAKITITTKVGLYSPGGSEQSRGTMLARKVGGKLWPRLSRAVADLSVERARRSLDESLRRLRRDRVELLLLHEPDPSLLQTDEWLRWYETESDRISNVGIAGPARSIVPFLKLGGPLTQVIQVSDSLDTHEADVVLRAGRPLQLTYGYFSSDRSGRSGGEILSRAIERNRTGAIVVYSRSRARLGGFSSAAEQEKQC